LENKSNTTKATTHQEHEDTITQNKYPVPKKLKPDFVAFYPWKQNELIIKEIDK